LPFKKTAKRNSSRLTQTDLFTSSRHSLWSKSLINGFIPWSVPAFKLSSTVNKSLKRLPCGVSKWRYHKRTLLFRSRRRKAKPAANKYFRHITSGKVQNSHIRLGWRIDFFARNGSPNQPANKAIIALACAAFYAKIIPSNSFHLRPIIDAIFEWQMPTTAYERNPNSFDNVFVEPNNRFSAIVPFFVAPNDTISTPAFHVIEQE